MDNLNKDTGPDRLDDNAEEVNQQVEKERIQAQEVINESKEQAKRDWDGAYADTEQSVGEDPARLEGDAHHMKDDLDGSLEGAQGTDLSPDSRNTQEDGVTIIRGGSEGVGDSATGTGTDSHGAAHNARAETGREFDDTRRDSEEPNVNTRDGAGLAKVDQQQDSEKGFFDRLKDVFTGDKDS